MKKIEEVIKNNGLMMPDYNDMNIVLLMRCLYSRCGYDIKENEKIKELDKMIPRNRHYIFILSDGTGANLIDKLDDGSILKQNRQCNMLTVFPSTTGCALTSLVTAEYPEVHGIWGWFNYNRELNRDYYPVLFLDRKTERSLSEFDIDQEDIYKSESVLKKLSVKTNIIFPENIVDSVYSKFVGRDSDRYSYKDFSQIIDLVNDITRNNEKSYTYLYIPDVDTIEHEYGKSSYRALDKLKEIDELVKEISKVRDTTIIFTADHGQIDVEEDIILEINKYNKFFYAYPSIDFGTASYYIKEEYMEEFVLEFEKDFKDKMFLFKTEEFINSKLFGRCEISEYARNNLGEYISICKPGGHLVYLPDTIDCLGNIKGNHSGLTCDEMIVPLVVINTAEIVN